MMISECCTKEKPLLCRAQSGDPDAIEHFLAGYVPLLRALASALDAVSKGNKDERIYLRADKSVSYGDLMEVMNLLRDAGYLKVALVGLDGRS